MTICPPRAARLNGRAVRVADGSGRELGRRNPHHGFIKSGDAFDELPEIDQTTTLPHTRERRQLGIWNRSADVAARPNAACPATGSPPSAHRNPTRPARGTSPVREVGSVRAFPGVKALVLPPGQVGDHRQAVEIVAVERAARVGCRRPLVHVSPSAAVERLSPVSASIAMAVGRGLSPMKGTLVVNGDPAADQGSTPTRSRSFLA